MNACIDAVSFGTEQHGVRCFIPLPLPRWPLSACTQLVFIDTEGFESTGKADVYDDRIFALSALMSQVCSGRRDRQLGQGWAGRMQE